MSGSELAVVTAGRDASPNHRLLAHIARKASP